jgi:hypothetical protein
VIGFLAFKFASCRSDQRLLDDDFEGRARGDRPVGLSRQQKDPRGAAEAVGLSISDTIACLDRTG